MTISEIAEVSSGQTISSQPLDGYLPLDEPLDLLHLSDFSDFGQPKLPFRTQLQHIPPAAARHQLHAGQILVSAKGARVFAAAVQPDWPPALASSSFFVLNLKRPELLPEFLALVLNLPRTREALLSLFTTVTIPTLSRRNLLQFELPLPDPIPSLERQRQLVELHLLWLQEKALTQRYLDTREQIIFSHISESINPKKIKQ